MRNREDFGRWRWALLVTKDWAEFGPRAYLEEYYADVGPENLALLTFFAKKAFHGLPAGSVSLDLGSGPTIYSLISAAASVREIHVCDFLEANLAEVTGWLREDTTAWDWSGFFEAALRLENDDLPWRVGEREALIRERVTQTMRCDLSLFAPLGRAVQPYDVLVTNFCAESATDDPEQWRAFLRNMASLLKPGGRLVTSALKGATSYAVGSKHFPAVSIDEEDLRQELVEIGFTPDSVTIESVPADRSQRHYQGIMMALATKREEA